MQLTGRTLPHAGSREGWERAFQAFPGALHPIALLICRPQELAHQCPQGSGGRALSGRDGRPRVTTCISSCSLRTLKWIPPSPNCRGGRDQEPKPDLHVDQLTTGLCCWGRDSTIARQAQGQQGLNWHHLMCPGMHHAQAHMHAFPHNTQTQAHTTAHVHGDSEIEETVLAI